MKIIVYDWMVCDLHLKRSELLVFAVIYAYRRGEWFNIPRKIIAEWVGITTRGVSKIVHELNENGLIEYKVLTDSEVGCYGAFKISENILSKYND